ncbi:MAG: hypothetical protein Q9213_004077 [Squamulea squamosa]
MVMPFVDDRISYSNSLPCAVKNCLKIFNKAQSIAEVSVEQLQLAFQLWVAYDLYGRRKEDLTSQLKCPLIGCSTDFESLGSCLQHLTNCKWLPNAWYWCPLCKRPERFTEPKFTLVNRSKVEPPPEIPRRSALPPQKSTIAKITNTRFWKHMRNKSRLLSPHPMSATFRPSRGVEVVPQSGQSLSEFGSGFVWNPHAPYDASFAILPADEKHATAQSSEFEYGPFSLNEYTALMQPSEVEAAPNSLSDDPWLNQRLELPSYQRSELPEQRPELESTPTYQPSELQGAQPNTERSRKTPKAIELPGDELHRAQQPEHDGSTPSYTKTRQAWPLYKHSSTTDCLQPLYSCDPTQTSFITGPLVAESPLHYDTGLAQSGPPSHSLGIVARRLTFPHYRASINTLSIDSTYTQQSTPFGQFACQKSQETNTAPMPPRIDRCQELAKTDAHGVEDQSNRKTTGWHNYPENSPSADYSEIANDSIPRFSDRAFPRNTATNSTITIMPYPCKEPHLTLGGEDYVGTTGILGFVEAANQNFYPVYADCQKARSGNIRRQENYLVSPVASSDATASPSSSTVSPMSSIGACRSRQKHGNHGQSPAMGLRSPSPPGTSSSSDGSSTKTRVFSSSTLPTSVEVSPVASQSLSRNTANFRDTKTKGTSHCPECSTEFRGSNQDRKQNMKRHREYNCSARLGPRERFKCPIEGCGRDYTRPDNLTKHQRQMHQGLPALQRSGA